MVWLPYVLYTRRKKHRVLSVCSLSFRYSHIIQVRKRPAKRPSLKSLQRFSPSSSPLPVRSSCKSVVTARMEQRVVNTHPLLFAVPVCPSNSVSCPFSHERFKLPPVELKLKLHII
jgi:hypothetical protein